MRGGRLAERRGWQGATLAAMMATLVLWMGAWPARAEGVPIPPPRPFPAAEIDPADVPPSVAPDGALPETGLPEPAPQVPAAPVAPPEAQPASPASPTRGAVTNLPLPRFVSLKTSEGNARRGPSLAHRIDWVFTRPGMPLRITAEYENWRRVEDVDGIGGWVHYALLSGTRSIVVIVPMADLRAEPDDTSTLRARVEAGVIGRVQDCARDWCRVSLDGGRGYMRKTAIWGVGADEVID